MRLTNKSKLIWLIFWVLFMFTSLANGTEALAAQLEEQNPETRIVQYSFTLKNNTNRLIEKTEFLTYAPVKQTFRQNCRNLIVSHPYQLIEDKLGNQILHFTFINLPPYASKIITIKAELILVSNGKNAAINKIPKAFLDPEKFVETDDPQILKIAKDLTGKENIKTANNIYSWVSESLEYTGFAGAEQGAAWALKHKKGDCTEFMDLFAALARANNIPVSRVAGYVMPESGQLTSTAFHNWAEFYDGGSWYVADPQKKKFKTEQNNYIAMRIIGPTGGNPMGDFNRFRLKGEGLTAKMDN